MRSMPLQVVWWQGGLLPSGGQCVLPSREPMEGAVGAGLIRAPPPTPQTVTGGCRQQAAGHAAATGQMHSSQEQDSTGGEAGPQQGRAGQAHSSQGQGSIGSGAGQGSGGQTTAAAAGQAHNSQRQQGSVEGGAGQEGRGQATVAAAGQAHSSQGGISGPTSAGEGSIEHTFIY